VRHLTLAEAAEALQLSVVTLKRYIYDGTLKSAKLPGGQHRIPEGEIDRLLSDGGATVSGHHSGDGAASAEQRIEVLEHWVSEIQADMDRIVASLEVLSNYCGRAAHPDSAADSSSGPPEVVILGPDCRRCDALYEQTVAALRAIGRPEITWSGSRTWRRSPTTGPC
jgi:excisionase family DNA binding protein